MSNKLLISIALVAGLAGSGAWAVDADCAGCHDVAPVPDGHMEVDEVSVESCTMCHEADGSDPFFATVHEMHGEALGCDTCHVDADENRKAKLKEMLGK